ncbi:hypothetical protein MHU86_25674 [Fragilaria crotonensis]|nr:hypothetical protein MHU86_25674 [Fragilaria crotonensis]
MLNLNPLMRQVRRRRFFVGLILVSVTTARGCSVCGVGYIVGSPSAITSIRFPEQSDTQYTCSDLEFAGLEGLIPSEDCSVFPSLIFETCDCQEDSKSVQSKHEDSDSQHGSGHSSQRQMKSWFASPAPGSTSPPVSAPIVAITSPPVATPFLYRPSVSGPMLAPNFVPAPVATPPRPSAPSNSYGQRPTFTYNPPIPKPTEPPADPVAYVVVQIMGSMILFCFCIVMMNTETRGTSRSSPAQGNRHQIQATTTTTTTTRMPTTTTSLPMIPASTPPMQWKEEALARRPLVLAVLFPDEGNKVEGDDGGPITSGRSLKYDAQSKHYIFCDDPGVEATTCSICLEILVPDDDTVTGLCSHVYHRECIMNWLQDCNDACPNCRQPMWDPETYMMVDQQIKDQNSGSPSPPSMMLSP